jgi:hypothetical protein
MLAAGFDGSTAWVSFDVDLARRAAGKQAASAWLADAARPTLRAQA